MEKDMTKKEFIEAYIKLYIDTYVKVIKLVSKLEK